MQLERYKQNRANSPRGPFTPLFEQLDYWLGEETVSIFRKDAIQKHIAVIGLGMQNSTNKMTTIGNLHVALWFNMCDSDRDGWVGAEDIYDFCTALGLEV